MPRKDLITRSVKGTHAHVMQVGVNEGTVSEAEYTVRGSYKTEKNLLKALKNLYEDSDTVILKVISFEPIEQLLGMYVSDFIDQAFPLDENRKPIADVTDDDIEDAEEQEG